VILAREMGLRAEVEDVQIVPLFPAEPLAPGTLDELYAALRDHYRSGGPAGRSEVSVERVGDCVAPRRAHAAVIEGERVGSAL